jgi:peptidylprolyl isomerase
VLPPADSNAASAFSRFNAWLWRLAPLWDRQHRPQEFYHVRYSHPFAVDRRCCHPPPPDLAPQHVERITALANEGFYDDVVFHRVIPGFMAQGGDPTGTGMGGSELPDLPQEFSSEPHVRGVCSMARAQNPNSANSQFFICFDDAGFLDKQYTVWGEVIEGMENVDALPKGEPPREPGKIVKATVS